MDKKLTDVTDNNVGKMNDNEIKKALECCITSDCRGCALGHRATGKYNEHCGTDLMKNALNLINRKDEQIEQLRTCNDGNLESINKLNDLINRLQEDKQNLEIELQAMRNAANGFKAEVERLKKFALIRAFDRFQKEAKTEAYKEFAELLEQRFALYYGMKIDFTNASKIVNNLLKELGGE